MTRIVLLLGSAAAIAAAALAPIPAGAQTVPDPTGLDDTAPTQSLPTATGTRHVSVVPYIEADQVGQVDLNSGDAVTYTQLSAGVDATVDTARASAQLSYRYDHLFGETDHLPDSDLHEGLARASYRLTPSLSVEGGAILTRARSDIRGAAPVLTDTYSDNLTQVYSVYAGPTFATRAGDLDLSAAYRFGYTKAEAPGSVGVVAGPRLDYFDSSIDHSVTASAGIAPGRSGLPVGITVTGGWDRETAGQLDQRFEDEYGRGDVLLPVSGTLALTAGVGYQRIQVSQKDAVVDATGAPVVDANGRFETNDASPRRIAYNTDGLIYDAGVVWKPSPRTSLTATVAHQYGSTSYTGDFSWEIQRDLAFQLVGYDGIETFGHQLREGLQQLPTNFLTERDAFGQQFNGCVFGANPGTPGQGIGGCLNDVFQSIQTASYRARGVDAVLSLRRGRDSFGIGAGWANRHLFSPRTAPGVVLYGLDNDSYYAQAFYSRTLDQRSTFDVNVFADYYTSELPGSDDVFGAGGTAAYSRSFGRISATAAAGVYTFSQQGQDDQWSAQGLLGARYSF